MKRFWIVIQTEKGIENPNMGKAYYTSCNAIESEQDAIKATEQFSKDNPKLSFFVAEVKVKIESEISYSTSTMKLDIE